jgi:hypothetical protein
MKDTTEVVCRFKDTCNAVPFAQQPEDIDLLQWIWDFQGQLMVVSTPFHEGCHWAKYLGEFLPIVIRLKELHDAGYVHGDIRCLNLIFPDGKRKHPGIAKDTDLFHLIDFDFGGKLNASPPLVYPEGYRGSLIDGRRIGMRGKEITKWHDWLASKEIIFFFHIIQLPPDPPTEVLFESHYIRSIFPELQSDEDSSRDVDSLVAFPDKFQDWEVKLQPALACTLQRLGLYGNGTKDKLFSGQPGAVHNFLEWMGT